MRRRRFFGRGWSWCGQYRGWGWDLYGNRLGIGRRWARTLLLAAAGARADKIGHLTGGESNSLEHPTIKGDVTFTRQEEFATKEWVVFALSVETGVAFEGTRKHIGAISDICLSVKLAIEGTRCHRQWRLVAIAKRSDAFVVGAPIDTAATGTAFE